MLDDKLARRGISRLTSLIGPWHFTNTRKQWRQVKWYRLSPNTFRKAASQLKLDKVDFEVTEYYNGVKSISLHVPLDFELPPKPKRKRTFDPPVYVGDPPRKGKCPCCGKPYNE